MTRVLSINPHILQQPLRPTISKTSTLSSGLVAWYPMTPPGGQTVFDISGNGYHGNILFTTDYNNAWKTDPERGWCLNFTEVWDVDIPRPGWSEIWRTGKATVSIWAKSLEQITSVNYMCGSYSVGGFGLGIANLSGQQPLFLAGNNYATFLGQYNPLQWNHYVGVCDGRNIRVYVNGVRGTDAITSTPITDSLASGVIGDVADNTPGGHTGDGWFGYLQDMRLWSRPLNDAEVWQLYDVNRRYSLFTKDRSTIPVIRPPVIKITSPANNATATGPLTVTCAIASYVYCVDYQIDGVTIASSVLPPFSATIDTTICTNDTHSLKAIAYTFIPTSLPNCATWIDFSDVTSMWTSWTQTTQVANDGDYIGYITDKSGYFGSFVQNNTTGATVTGTASSSGTTVTATTGIFTSGMVGFIITSGTTFVKITAFTDTTHVTVDSAPSWSSASITVSPDRRPVWCTPGSANNLLSSSLGCGKFTGTNSNTTTLLEHIITTNNFTSSTGDVFIVVEMGSSSGSIFFSNQNASVGTQIMEFGNQNGKVVINSSFSGTGVAVYGSSTVQPTVPGSPPSAGTRYVINYRCTGSAYQLYVNGNLELVQMTGSVNNGSRWWQSFTTNSVTVGGARFSNTSFLWTACQIGEIIAYNGLLSDSNRSAVEQYLAKKWAPQMPLPITYTGSASSAVTITTSNPTGLTWPTWIPSFFSHIKTMQNCYQGVINDGTGLLTSPHGPVQVPPFDTTLRTTFFDISNGGDLTQMTALKASSGNPNLCTLIYNTVEQINGYNIVDWYDYCDSYGWPFYRTLFQAAVAYANGVYTNETSGAQNTTTGDMTLLAASPTLNDAYYIGSSTQFGYINLWISQSGVPGTGSWTITWQYWNGSAWTNLSGVVDGSAGFTAFATGIYLISFTIPGNWATTSVNSQGPYYYVRALLSSYTSGTGYVQPKGARITSPSYEDAFFHSITPYSLAGTNIGSTNWPVRNWWDAWLVPASGLPTYQWNSTFFTTLDAGATTGTVTSSGTTVTATTGIFSASSVGLQISNGTTRVTITGFTSSTQVTVNTAPSWTSQNVIVGGVAASTTQNSYILFGYSEPVDSIYCTIATPASGGWTGVLEYVSGVDADGVPLSNGWSPMGISSDGTSNWTIPFSGTGTVQFTTPFPSPPWLRSLGIATNFAAAISSIGGVFTDQTTASTDTTTNDMTLMGSSPAVNDAYYFGHTAKFTVVNIVISQQGAGTWTTVWEYWNGAWTALPRVADPTAYFTGPPGHYAVQASQSNNSAPSDWVTSTINGQGPYYYMRVRVKTFTAITTQPLGKRAYANAHGNFTSGYRTYKGYYLRIRTTSTGGTAPVFGLITAPDFTGQGNVTFHAGTIPTFLSTYDSNGNGYLDASEWASAGNPLCRWYYQTRMGSLYGYYVPWGNVCNQTYRNWSSDYVNRVNDIRNDGNFFDNSGYGQVFKPGVEIIEDDSQYGFFYGALLNAIWRGYPIRSAGGTKFCVPNTGPLTDSTISSNAKLFLGQCPTSWNETILQDLDSWHAVAAHANMADVTQGYHVPSPMVFLDAISNYGTAQINELVITGSPTGGTFTITCPWIPATTGPITVVAGPYVSNNVATSAGNQQRSNIQTALRALSGLSAITVDVDTTNNNYRGGSAGGFPINWFGVTPQSVLATSANAGSPPAIISCNTSGMTGGTSPGITVLVLQPYNATLDLTSSQTGRWLQLLLAYYYIVARPNNYFSVLSDEGTTSDWNPNRWWNAIATNVGQPTNVATVYATGQDPGSANVFAACIAYAGTSATPVGTTNFTNETSLNGTTNALTIMQSSPQVNNAYYFGQTYPFSTVQLTLGTSGVKGTGGAWTITWEYWTGSAWTALAAGVAGFLDPTNGFTAPAGTYIVNLYTRFSIPGVSLNTSAWATTTVNNQGPYYYVRARVSAYTSGTGFVQAKGTQATRGLTYQVLQRNYDNALMIYKPVSYVYDGNNWDDISNTGNINDDTVTTHQLPGYPSTLYYPLNSSGTTGSGTNTITLRNAEGAVLMLAPLPYQSSIVCTSNVSATLVEFTANPFISLPLNGATISGTTNVSIVANQPFDYVNLIIDGVQRTTALHTQGQGYASPFTGTVTLDTNTLSQGTHTLAVQTFTGSGRTFVPTSLTGCVLWVDFADTNTITLNAGNVASITDKSGTGVSAFVQATGSKQPTYVSNGQNGLGYVTFNPSNSQILISPSALTATAGDVFIVANCLTNSQFIFGQVAPAVNNNFLIFQTQNVAGNPVHNNELEINASFSGTTRIMRGASVLQVNGNIFCGTYRCQGSPTNAYNILLNGTDTAATGTNNDGSRWFGSLSGTQQMQIGGIIFNAFSGYSQINVHEIIVFNNTLSSSDRQAVENYLMEKWGIGTTVYSTQNTAAITVTANNATGLTAAGIPRHYNHIRIGVLKYDSPMNSTDLALLDTSVDFANVSQASVATQIKAVSNTACVLYNNYVFLDWYQIVDWLNYADTNLAGTAWINRELAFWHVSQTTTPLFSNWAGGFPAWWWWDIQKYSGSNLVGQMASSPPNTAGTTTGIGGTYGSDGTGFSFSNVLNDYVMFGYPDQFSEIVMTVSTASSGFTWTLEYCSGVNANGTPNAWTAISMTDGTSNGTTSGTITFNPVPATLSPAWITCNSVVGGAGFFKTGLSNGNKGYYVRLKTTSTGGTAPTVFRIGTVDYLNQSANGIVSSSGTTITATTSIFTSSMVGWVIAGGGKHATITAFTSGTQVTVDTGPSPAWSSTRVFVTTPLGTIPIWDATGQDADGDGYLNPTEYTNAGSPTAANGVPIKWKYQSRLYSGEVGTQGLSTRFADSNVKHWIAAGGLSSISANPQYDGLFTDNSSISGQSNVLEASDSLNYVNDYGGTLNIIWRGMGLGSLGQRMISPNIGPDTITNLLSYIPVGWRESQMTETDGWSDTKTHIAAILASSQMYSPAPLQMLDYLYRAGATQSNPNYGLAPPNSVKMLFLANYYICAIDPGNSMFLPFSDNFTPLGPDTNVYPNRWVAAATVNVGQPTASYTFHDGSTNDGSGYFVGYFTRPFDNAFVIYRPLDDNGTGSSNNGTNSVTTFTTNVTLPAGTWYNLNVDGSISTTPLTGSVTVAANVGMILMNYTITPQMSSIIGTTTINALATAVYIVNSAITPTSAIVANNQLAIGISSAISCSTAISATAILLGSPSCSITITATVNGLASAVYIASGPLTGTGTLSATTQSSWIVSSSITGSGDLTLNPKATYRDSAGITGVVTVTPNGGLGIYRTNIITGVATVTATAAAAYHISLAIAPTSTIVAAAKYRLGASSAIAPTVTLTATPIVGVVLPITGTATIVGMATANYSGTAHLAGTASVLAQESSNNSCFANIQCEAFVTGYLLKPITGSDIAFVLSGGTNNRDSNLSLGGEPSTWLISNDELFQDISPTDAQNGLTDYRCFYIFNDSSDGGIANFSIEATGTAATGTVISLGMNNSPDIQQIEIKGTVTGGSFVLQYQHLNSPDIQWDPVVDNWAANIQQALAVLLDVFSVSVTGTQYDAETIIFDVEFTDFRYRPLLVLQSNDLQGTSIDVNIVKINDGSPINSIAPQIATDTTTPANVTFYALNTPIFEGTLFPEEGFPVWVRRIVAAGSSGSYTFTVTINGST